MLKIVGCIGQQHDLRLVLLAVALGGLAAFTTCNLLSRACVYTSWARRAWLSGSAMAFGCGAWSMHFIAMLAFRPQSPIVFELDATAVSLLIAIIAGGIAFTLYSHRPGSAATLALAAVVLGAGISAMHFIGMMALRSSGSLGFDPAYMAPSIAMAAVGSLAALWAHRTGRLISATACLVLAIASMHFTAMAALTFTPMAPDGPRTTAISVEVLATATIMVSLLIVALSLVSAWFDRHFAHRTHEEAQRFRRLADAAFEGILFHRSGVVTDCNHAMTRMLHAEAEALVGRRVTDLIILTPAHLMTDSTGAAPLETTIRKGPAAGRPIEVASRAIDTQRQTFVLSVRDIADRKAAEEKIQRLIYQDQVTGLGNRNLFADRAHRMLELGEHARAGVTFFCLDLDRFKEINDSFGHAVGDGVLAEVGRRIQSVIRQSDVVSRMGGDEFAIVTYPSSGNQDDVAGQAQRLIDRVCGIYRIDNHEIPVSVSVGMALYPADGSSVDELTRNADMALYQAKREGRGTYCFFHRDIDNRLRERRALERDLKSAIENNEFYLEYQAVFDSQTMSVAGQEALVRWKHPERGTISPGTFIPLAEDTGLIVPLGCWILEMACSEAAGRPASQFVAVNLSPAQFRGRDVVRDVADVLQRTGLPAERLELEITEGILIEDSQRTLATLNALRALGVRISLDDFGIGYSSLSYLHRFRFNKIKIDKSFVQSLGHDPEAAVIIRSIVALGHSLRIDVTAEGIETAEQLDWIRQRRCDYLQGFLLGKPVRPAAASPSAPSPWPTFEPDVHDAPVDVSA